MGVGDRWPPNTSNLNSPCVFELCQDSFTEFLKVIEFECNVNDQINVCSRWLLQKQVAQCVQLYIFLNNSGARLQYYYCY